jgi:hypothetical protein
MGELIVNRIRANSWSSSTAYVEAAAALAIWLYPLRPSRRTCHGLFFGRGRKRTAQRSLRTILINNVSTRRGRTERGILLRQVYLDRRVLDLY